MLCDAPDRSRQLVHRPILDTVLGECSTEQEFAKRRDEKSLQGPASILPFHNCVLYQMRETETASEGRGRGRGTGLGSG